MAYLEGHGPSGDGDGSFESGRDEESVDFSRKIAIGVVCAALLILAASLVSSNEPDASPWTSGSAALGFSLVAIAAAAGFVYRAIRRAGGTSGDGSVGILTVILATPMAVAAGFVVLAIFGVPQ